MSDQGNDDAKIDPRWVEPLLTGLNDDDPRIRIGSLWSLLALPHPAERWIVIGASVRDALLDRDARPSSELQSAIAATPWIPLASIRDVVKQLASGQLGCSDSVRRQAAQVLELPAEPAVERPDAFEVEPVGFSSFTVEERARLSEELSKLSTDQMWTRLDHESSQPSSHPTRAVLVTLLMDRVGAAGDIAAAGEVTRWVEGRGTDYVPDLDGLFGQFLRLRQRSPRGPQLFIGRQIAWLISRGGVIPAVAALHDHLTSDDLERRLSALSAIQYAGAFRTQRTAPRPASGAELEPDYQEPSMPRPTTLIDDVEDDGDELQVDEDVQFTVYRPSAVTPEVWHPLVAFAHRTDPVTLPSGTVIDPVREVEERATHLLSDLPTSYETVRTDSRSGLPRGTDLLFEPWIEQGEFNPRMQSLSWEEAVHEVHFRLKVPQRVEGSRVRGGMRVFAGAVLIGELSFRLPVVAEHTAATEAIERETTRGFKQIFASYSHLDGDVVEALERYVSVTGDRYLIDTRTLRSGEVWDERLREQIREADVFQLFWSRNAMASIFVEREWQYALQLGREGFVRPVYWEDPLPEDPARGLPPERLRRLHFSWLDVARLRPGESTDAAEVRELDVPTDDPVSLPPPAGDPVAPGPPVRDQVRCVSCGFASPETASFCANCGSFLEWTGEKVGASPAEVEPEASQPGRTGTPPVPPDVGTSPSSPTPGRAPQASRRVDAPDERRPASKIQPGERRPASKIQPGDLICGTCGEGNSPARKFCRRCGVSLGDAVVAGSSWWQRRAAARRRKAAGAAARPRDADAARRSPRHQRSSARPRSAALPLLALGVLVAAVVIVLLIAL